MSTVLGRIDFGATLKTTAVPIPELGGSIRLQQMTVGQLEESRGGEFKMARSLSFMIVDAEGNRIYTTDDDIRNLSKMPVNIFTKLSDAMNELNGSSAEAIDDASKKSEPVPSTASVSD